VTTPQLATVASQWVSHRDKLQARHHVLGNVKQREFTDALDAHARQIGGLLPDMNSAEAQGFMELVIQWVALRRMAEDTFRKK
jgi:hypothetical protein